jgi:hypothetical protein
MPGAACWTPRSGNGARDEMSRTFSAGAEADTVNLNVHASTRTFSPWL